jgi:t-SNARE syntaxin family protein
MMSSINEQDPFLQVQAYVSCITTCLHTFLPFTPTNKPPSDVLSQLSTTRSLFTSYLRIRSLSTSPSSPELTSARSDLETSLSTLAEDLTDLVASVRAVESDPHKYGLEIEEVLRRKRLVEEVGGEIEDMREELAKQILRTAHAQQRRGSVSIAVDEGPLAAGSGGAGDSYEEFEQQQQLRMMHEQDEQLDGVFQTVGNLRQQADDMGRELEEQAEMLEVVDTLADRVGGRLQTGIQKVGYVMRKNEDRMSSCCIGVLILVLIILLILVLVI